MLETLAICLLTRPFQEADRLVWFYTAGLGEVRAIAKGVKRPTSKLAGACEPLTLNHVSLAPGRSLYTVCHYERVASFPVLRQDMIRLAAAQVMTDVLRVLSHAGDPVSHEVYVTLARALGCLDDPASDWGHASLGFHRTLLTLAGYWPSVSHCVHCDTPLDLSKQPAYPFSVALGGFLCGECQALAGQSVRVSVTTMRLLADPETPVRPTALEKAHRFLAYYWEHRLERSFPSFHFLFQVLPLWTPTEAAPPAC